MKVILDTETKHHLTVHGWSSDSWMRTLRLIEEQLKTTKAIWPELTEYVIRKKGEK